MADVPLSHNSTASAQNTTSSNEAPCTQSAHALPRPGLGNAKTGSAPAQHCAAPVVTHTSATADLPLRQARTLPGSLAPKIHDITDKFTRACNGMFSSSLAASKWGIAGLLLKQACWQGDAARGGWYKDSLLTSSQPSKSVNSSKMTASRYSSPLGRLRYGSARLLCASD